MLAFFTSDGGALLIGDSINAYQTKHGTWKILTRHYDKIRRLDSGLLVGMAGDTALAEEFFSVSVEQLANATDLATLQNGLDGIFHGTDHRFCERVYPDPGFRRDFALVFAGRLGEEEPGILLLDSQAPLKDDDLVRRLYKNNRIVAIGVRDSSAYLHLHARYRAWLGDDLPTKEQALRMGTYLVLEANYESPSQIGGAIRVGLAYGDGTTELRTEGEAEEINDARTDATAAADQRWLEVERLLEGRDD